MQRLQLNWLRAHDSFYSLYTSIYLPQYLTVTSLKPCSVDEKGRKYQVLSDMEAHVTAMGQSAWPHWYSVAPS